MPVKKYNISVSVTIPLYNSEKTLEKELEGVAKVLESTTNEYEIIVVDDLSTDKSRTLLEPFKKRKEFRVYLNKKNIGIAQNLKKVYSLSRKQYIVLYSVDGDWEPSDISKLIDCALKTNADIVIGKRINKKGYTPYRKLITKIHNLVPKVLFGIDTIDAASIKLFRRSVYKQIHIKSKSVFSEAELIIRASQKGYIVTSTPVRYSKKRFDKKNYITLHLLRDSLIDALKLRLVL